MIVDLGETVPDALPDYDLCVIGTGPAGATLLAELRDAGLRLCALESGRRRPDRAAGALAGHPGQGPLARARAGRRLDHLGRALRAAGPHRPAAAPVAGDAGLAAGARRAAALLGRGCRALPLRAAGAVRGGRLRRA